MYTTPSELFLALFVVGFFLSSFFFLWIESEVTSSVMKLKIDSARNRTNCSTTHRIKNLTRTRTQTHTYRIWFESIRWTVFWVSRRIQIRCVLAEKFRCTTFVTWNFTQSKSPSKCMKFVLHSVWNSKIVDLLLFVSTISGTCQTISFLGVWLSYTIFSRQLIVVKSNFKPNQPICFCYL